MKECRAGASVLAHACSECSHRVESGGCVRRLQAGRCGPDNGQGRRLRALSQGAAQAQAADAGDRIGLLRGCESSVTELLATCGAQPTFEEVHCEGRPIKVEFKGALRSERAPAVEVLAACDAGVRLDGGGRQPDRTLQGEHARPRGEGDAARAISRDRRGAVGASDADRTQEQEEALHHRPDRRRKHLSSGVIVIALIPALFEKGDHPGDKRVIDLVGSYGVVICDECHHVSVFSFEKVMRASKARYVHGL